MLQPGTQYSGHVSEVYVDTTGGHFKLDSQGDDRFAIAATTQTFAEMITFVRVALKQGGVVYVGTETGVPASTAILISYILEKK
jgi:hypothetical protein